MIPTLNVKTVNGGLSSFDASTKNPKIHSGNSPNKFFVFPLIDYYKRPLTPRVAVGDSVQSGEPLADGLLASTSGVVTAIEKRAILHPSNPHVVCAIVHPDSKETSVAIPPLDTTNLESLTPYNIVGLGGAAFPLVDKLRSALVRPMNTLIINAVECEPLISCDDVLIQLHAKDVLLGIRLLMQFCGIDSCVIAIKANMSDAIAALEAELPVAQCGADSSGLDPRGTAIGMRGDNDRGGDPEFLNHPAHKSHGKHIAIQLVEDKYPAGAECTLVRTLTGSPQRGHDRPSESGILCVNVATAHALHEASRGKPLLGRIISVTDRSSTQPRNVWARFGLSIRDVLELAGHTHYSGAVVIGGPISGITTSDLTLPITASVNSVLLEAFTEKSPQPCIRCGDCASVCPSDLLPQQLFWHAQSINLPALEKFGLQECIECACCDLVCPSSIPLTQLFRHAKDQFQQHIDEQVRGAWAERRHENHLQRTESRKTKRKPTKSPSSQTLERLKKQRREHKPSEGDSS